jgi:hypothetical protein
MTKDDISLISEITLYSYSASHLPLVLRLSVLYVLDYILSSVFVFITSLSEPTALH